MDSPRVLGIGVGLFVLVFLWVLSLLLCVLMSRASRPLRFVSVGVFLLVVIITLVLVFFPKQTPSVPVVKELVITDDFFIGRYVLLTFSLLALLVAIALAIVFHVLEPVYGQPLKSR
ncbi:transmembrane protein 218 [Lampetra fluviatilis]